MFKVERAVPSHKCMFFTSGLSGFTAVHRCKVTLCQMTSFQLKQQMLDSLAMEHILKEWATLNIH